MSTEDFNTALAAFITALQAITDGFYKGEATIEIAGGRRYVRIARTCRDQRSAYCFVDSETGDILKPATWKAPAKNFARGNIFEAHSFSRFDPCGL